MIDREHELSIKRQCQLLALNRSTVYYQTAAVSEEDLALMRRIDEMHLKRPFYGSRRIRDWLQDEGYEINRKRVQRLMRQMGIRALYPMARGFAYLVAIIDWYSRKVLAWRLSNTLDSDFCVEALEEALQRFGTPEIFNTDQGAQFTSEAFTGMLKQAGVVISMDGKGRWIDNVFVKRLWRSVKYEDVYLKAYESLPQVRVRLREYFHFFNSERRHQRLNRHTPNQVYRGEWAWPKAA